MIRPVDRRAARERFFRERDAAGRRQAGFGQGCLDGRMLAVYMPCFHRMRSRNTRGQEPR